MENHSNVKSVEKVTGVLKHYARTFVLSQVKNLMSVMHVNFVLVVYVILENTCIFTVKVRIKKTKFV